MLEEGPRMPIRHHRREDLPEDLRHNYDLIVEPRGGLSRFFGVLLNSPEMGGRIGHLGAYLRFEGVIGDAERELAILIAAREFDCPYEWAAHEPIAREVGVDDRAIESVGAGGPLEGLDEADALLVRYGRELFRDHGVSDGTFEAAMDRFDVQGLTELTATFGYYWMLACVQNAFRIPPSEDGPELPARSG